MNTIKSKKINTINEIKIISPEDLVPILHRELDTIKTDARRRPQSLPPRLKIPGSSKLLWLEEDVIEWLNNCRTVNKG